MNIQAAIDALTAKGIEIDLNPASVKAKSRDFFWYSPVLKDRLDHVVADFVATPLDQDQVIEVLATCYAHDVPVTTRAPVYPDGCRKVLILRRPGARPEVRVTPLDLRPRGWSA